MPIIKHCLNAVFFDLIDWNIGSNHNLEFFQIVDPILKRTTTLRNISVSSNYVILLGRQNYKGAPRNRNRKSLKQWYSWFSKNKQLRWKNEQRQQYYIIRANIRRKFRATQKHNQHVLINVFSIVYFNISIYM